MSRPVRLELSGGLYHVTARGDRREPIYEDDADRVMFLEHLGDVINAHNWLCHAYCLMTNHYHFVIETPDGNLSKGMRQLYGVYAQKNNRRHRRVGHMFQGRYKAILVDSDEYLLELSRYVVLNPVRAKMVERVGDYPWSSYKATAGIDGGYGWLEVDAILSLFSSRRTIAQTAYQCFVEEGVGEPSPLRFLQQQVYLGSDEFIAKAQRAIEKSDDLNIPKAQRRPPAPSLEVIAKECSDREEAINAAYATGAYTYQQIGDYFGVHFTTVGRIVRGQSKN